MAVTLDVKCCEQCWHAPNRPCPELVECLTEGPLCHESEHHRKCRRQPAPEPLIPLGRVLPLHIESSYFRKRESNAALSLTRTRIQNGTSPRSDGFSATFRTSYAPSKPTARLSV